MAFNLGEMICFCKLLRGIEHDLVPLSNAKSVYTTEITILGKIFYFHRVLGLFQAGKASTV